MTDAAARAERSKVSSTGLIALVLALAAFPLFKVQVVEHLPSVVRYGDTGLGPGRLVWAATYIGGEILIAGLCLASVFREGRTLSDVGLAPPRSRAWWMVLGVGLFVAGTLIVLRHADVIEIMGRAGQDYGVLAARNTWQRIEGVLTSAVAVPIEELIWRGFAITRLERLGAPTWLAILLPSAAFAYFHGGTVDTLAVSMAVGAGVIILSAIFVRQRSIAWPILLHFTWNIVLLSVTPTPI